MRKVFIRIAAAVIKYSATIFLFRTCLEQYRHDLPWYVQSPVVWMGLYLPLLLGYETLAKLVFDTLSGSKPIEKR